MALHFRKQRAPGADDGSQTESIKISGEVSSRGVSSGWHPSLGWSGISERTSHFLCALFDMLMNALHLLFSLAKVTFGTDNSCKPGNVHPAASIKDKKPLYEFLETGQIRVFCMLNDQSDAIMGQLKTISVERRPGLAVWPPGSQPRYEALSYCWGDREKTTIITINGHEENIQVNLYDALRVLRAKRPGVPIWADAICINQKDKAEKRVQIKMMGKIYQNARKVWAFLGKGPAGIDEAMPLIPLLCTKAQELETPLYSAITKSVQSGESQLSNIPILRQAHIRQIAGLPAPGSPFWSTIYDLVYSEYFNRLWVLQEAAFATQIEFLCGSHQISWAQMKLLFGPGLQQMAGFRAPPPFPPKTRNTSVFVMREILRNEGLDVGFFPRMFLSLVQKYYPLMISFMEKHLSGNDPELLSVLKPILDASFLLGSVNFERMLEVAVVQDCSEPEDRILAILGLLEAKGNMGHFLWTSTESPCELYIEAFYHLVQKDTSFLLLSMAPDKPESSLGLPSWCPTFHRSNGLQSGETPRFNAKDRNWQASHRKQTVNRGNDSMKLSLIGIQVCPALVIPGSWTAINTGDKQQTVMEIQAKVKANYQWVGLCLAAVLSGIDESSPLFRSTLDKFWRTMILDNPFSLSERDLSCNDCWAAMKLLERSASPESSFVTERARLSIPPNGPASREILFIIAMDSYITHKPFFVTDNGLFGLTYQGVQTGDILCVFQGARMPHLLRRRDAGSWTFVGEAYVAGIMHGEAEERVDGRLRETEIFTLV